MNIVILHGWGHSAQMWQGFASKFQGHKVAVFDLPGFGEEKLVSENWDIPDYADWVIKKLQARKLTNIVLIGHSFGGKIATEIAIKNPKLIAKLVLIASPVLRRPSLYIKSKIAVYKLFKNALPRRARTLFFADEYKDASERKMGEIFKKSVEYDRTSKLPNLALPLLIIWGDRDETAPTRVAHEMHSLIKNSELEIINGGHNLQFENENMLFGLISKFINA